MSGEKADSESRMIVTFEVRPRPGANVEEGLAMQQHLHEVARNTPSIGEIEGRSWMSEDGALMTVYTFRSKEAMQEFVRHPDHLEAMRLGKKIFSSTRVQIASLDKQTVNTYDR